ncbi:MAG: hypothetical protein WBN83_09380 [Desulfoprunum sp.]|uniref:hypothetical protein n=1 Tax=Desulfoprunum sp. TaxID=2020866 RepID=UPI003C72FF54
MMQINTVMTSEFNLSADCEVFRRAEQRINGKGIFVTKLAVAAAHTADEPGFSSHPGGVASGQPLAENIGQ